VNFDAPVTGVGRSFILFGGEVFGFLSSISNIESAAIFAFDIFGAKVLTKKKFFY
jgi:hypothetical protein